MHVDNLEIKVLSSRKDIDKVEEIIKSLGKFVKVDVEFGRSEDALKQAIMLCQSNPNYLFRCMMRARWYLSLPSFLTSWCTRPRPIRDLNLCKVTCCPRFSSTPARSWIRFTSLLWNMPANL